MKELYVSPEIKVMSFVAAENLASTLDEELGTTNVVSNVNTNLPDAANDIDVTL